MISLDVENYCHNCHAFEPRCARIYANNVCVDTLVQCERKEVCSNLKTYIEQQMANTNKREDK